MSEKKDSSQLHQRLVLGLVDYMKGEQWDVVHVAGVAGYQEPFAIGGGLPDVIAKREGGLIAVGKAETCERLSDRITFRELKALSHLTNTGDKGDVPLYVIVPASCIMQLTDLVDANYADKAQSITCVKMAGV